MTDDGQIRVALACQGGGSHTAFTAGVLQRLLAEDRYDYVALSGTSGGAVCALLTWYGLSRGDRQVAADLLDDFWNDMAALWPWDMWLNQMLVTAGRLEGAVLMPAISPYLLPPWGLDRLRHLLSDRVLTAAFAQPIEDPLLLVGAVNVLSGDFMAFSSAASDPDARVSVEAVLASAAVPNLFPAVPVGGGLYWDGLFSQNPPVKDLFDAQPDEIWVVRINPRTTRREPRLWADIVDRRNELAGNLSLVQELRFVDKINDLVATGQLTGGKYRKVPWDVISIGEEYDLDLASKLDRSPGFLRRLMAHGRQQADAFLARHGHG
jgi:NTE family protein